MRVLIIGPGKMKYMPYANFYLDNIDRNLHEVHVAYWNRDGKEEDLSNYEGLHLHEYRDLIDSTSSLINKVKHFYHFRKFCIKLIKKQNFDFLILLHTMPGVMLYDLLRKFYTGKYIYDYRDSTYEHKVFFFREIVGDIIRRSKVTFTSSDGFKEYFPKDCMEKVITSHNLLEESLNYRNYNKTQSDRLRICFWGIIRHIELNKCVIDRIADDERFELHYYGQEQIEALTLKEYVNLNKYTNIFFHGEYSPSDRYEFARGTDLIHNLYYDANMLRAVANKYYDGIIFRIPQICFPSSKMSMMSESAHVGVSINPCDSDFCDQLYTYYRNIDWSIFYESCDRELQRVMSEYEFGRSVINTIFG